MIANIMDMLFGCWHSNYSFPITQRPGQRRSAAAQATGTYVVCLDCGKEFAYDWKKMSVISSQPEEKRLEPVLVESLVESTGSLASKQAA